MSLIDKRVSAARWRLWVNRYLHFLGTCLLWAGLAWFLVVLIKKIFGLNIPVGYAAGAAAAAAFLTAVVRFLILAFVIFQLVRLANRIIGPPAAPATPDDVRLLTEIRDELRSRPKP